MSNKAWECPRCKRINAPFNSVCNCKPEILAEPNDMQNMLDEMAKKPLKPLFKYEEDELYINPLYCLNCGGYHGNLNGIGIQCNNSRIT